MDSFAVKFAPSLEKGNVLALLAREAGLKADDFRVLIALFVRVAAPGRDSAAFADLVAATALPPERVNAALAGLSARGFIETAGDASAGAANVSSGHDTGHRGRDRRTLDAGIMNYDLNLESLMRAGDTMSRHARSAATMPSPGGGTGAWDPLAGEGTRPAAIRFMVWLRFVLSPEELALSERFAIAHRAAWHEFIDRFGGAKAAGREGALIEDLRRRLASFGEAARGQSDEGERPPPPC